jgi:hypothetical protein
MAQFAQFVGAPIFDANQHMYENAGGFNEPSPGEVFAGNSIRRYRPADPHRDQ